jgi:two-component system, OmpR family, sensor kinase
MNQPTADSLAEKAATPTGWQHTQPLRRSPLDAEGKASADANELSFDLRPRDGLKGLFTPSDWQQLLASAALAACLLVAGEVLTHFVQSPRELRWAFAVAAVIAFALVGRRALQTLLHDALALRESALATSQGLAAHPARNVKTGALASTAELLEVTAARIEHLEHTQRATANAISNGLRTPLARMRFSTTYLEDARSADERATAVSNLREDLTTMEELVEASLLFARLSREDSAIGAELSRESFAIKPWIAKEIDTLRPLGAWVRLKLDMETIPAAAVLASADRKLLSLALRNVIRNAQRHAESTVMLDARITDGLLHLQIDDDGHGILPEHRERVFEPFSQVGNVGARAKDNSAGTGLGLAIARRVTRLHGGDLVAEDSILSGARLRLSVKI